MLDTYGRTYWWAEELSSRYDSWEVRYPVPAHAANLIGSQSSRNLHAPLLDIDLPASLAPLLESQGQMSSLLTLWVGCSEVEAQRVRAVTQQFGLTVPTDYTLSVAEHGLNLILVHPAYLLASSTPGHYHLYINVLLRWRAYKLLLKVLRDVGVIEQGFYKLSIERGQTFLRPPGITKTDDSSLQLVKV